MRSFERDERTVWVMPRDEQMMTWFQIVRIANVQSVRWVRGALNGQTGPVSARRAQLGGAGGALVWATYAGTRLAKPNPYRQTPRHEVGVAAASTRYAAAGYAWQRDEKPTYVGGHQADGIALGPEWMELIEVELAGKRMPRYVSIFRALCRRFDLGEMDGVAYLCNAESARAVREALMTIPDGRNIAARVTVQEVYDPAGQWIDDELPAWLEPAASRGAR